MGNLNKFCHSFNDSDCNVDICSKLYFDLRGILSQFNRMSMRDTGYWAKYKYEISFGHT